MDSIFSGYFEKIEKAVLSALPEDNIIFDEVISGMLSACEKKIYIKNLTAPCCDLIKAGGKRWRALLLILCNEASLQTRKFLENNNISLKDSGFENSIPDEKNEIYKIVPVIEFIHAASLIHDDIEDSSTIRRGEPAAHIKYGMDCALNSGSWLYFQAAYNIESLNVSEYLKNLLYRTFIEKLKLLHLGQSMDIYWHKNPEIIPSVQEYSAMISCKTGALVSLAVQSGLILGGANLKKIQEAEKIAFAIGEGFQILDDVKNLTTGNPGKKRGDDIIEGKKSLPIIIHLQKNPNDIDKIINCIKNAAANKSSFAIEECINLLNSSGAVNQAKEKGKNLICENYKKLTDLFYKNEAVPAVELIRQFFEDLLKLITE